MDIEIFYKNKSIYQFKIPNDFFELDIERKETLSIIYSTDMLKNIYRRISKNISVTLFYYELIDINLKFYENAEEYEICALLSMMKKNVQDSENRDKINILTSDSNISFE